MFFLDTKYISPLLHETLLKKQFSLYDFRDQQFLRGAERPLTNRVMMNSENAFPTFETLYAEKFPQLVNTAKIFKNKIAFRKQLAAHYPHFYFQEVTLRTLQTMAYDTLPYPLIVKPAKGYSSVGVFLLENATQFEETIAQLYTTMVATVSPDELPSLEARAFLLESYITGQEYAIDMYFNEQSEPVILNLFTRTFKDKNDMSDRVYYTSKETLQRALAPITAHLHTLQNIFNIPAMPLHIELRMDADGTIIPIEINPLRFAGEGTTDLGFYAYDICSHDYFIEQKQPDWQAIIDDMDDQLYAFTCASLDVTLAEDEIVAIDHDSLKRQFYTVLNYRQLPVASNETFAVIFYKCAHVDDFTSILQLDFTDYLSIHNTNESEETLV